MHEKEKQFQQLHKKFEDVMEELTEVCKCSYTDDPGKIVKRTREEFWKKVEQLGMTANARPGTANEDSVEKLLKKNNELEASLTALRTEEHNAKMRQEELKKQGDELSQTKQQYKTLKHQADELKQQVEILSQAKVQREALEIQEKKLLKQIEALSETKRQHETVNRQLRDVVLDIGLSPPSEEKSEDTEIVAKLHQQLKDFESAINSLEDADASYTA
jgi:DNA repair exonuclease SbcCD ATPase subunit